MSSVTQVTTFADLYTDLMNRVRVDSTQTMQITQAKRYINIALFDMHLGNGENFPWAERSARLLTQPQYSTGTVTVATGATAVTGSGTAWNTANDFGLTNVRAGGKILFSGDDTVYEVASVSTDTALVLTDKYRGSEDLSAAGYTYWEDEYALADDFLKPLDKQKFDGGGTIEIIDRREFKRMFTRVTGTGPITCASIFDKAFSGSTTPVRRVRFWRPPAEARYIPYSYVTAHLAVTSGGTQQAQLVNDTDEPIVPLYCRHAITFHALYHWYRDKKNDTRSQEAKGEYVDLITRLLGDVEVGARRPHIRPRVAGYANSARRPYSGASRGRYTTGSSFDENR